MRGAREFRGRAEEGTAGAVVSCWSVLALNWWVPGSVLGPTCICGDPGELGRQVPSKHGRNEQRTTGPMLFRLLRAAIPETHSRSICGEHVRVARQPSLKASSEG
jgi:hypothetical protein